MSIEILSSLKSRFQESVFATSLENRSTSLRAKKEGFHKILSQLKDAGFDHLSDATCVDYIDEQKFEIIYHLWSHAEKRRGEVRIQVPRESPSVKTISGLWEGAQIHEREIRELFGVNFEEHPNPSPLFLEGWEEIPPLRKDFDTREYVKREHYKENSGSRKEGDCFILPFGPQHPASGHFRAWTSARGEDVIGLIPYPGYLHRGIEKLMEHRTHEQNAMLVDRICILEPYSYELGYANVAEKIAGVEAPERAKFIRTVMTELGRILSHITWIGITSLAIGFDSACRIAWGDRERIIRLNEIVSGGRIYPCHFIPGGVRRDFPEGFVEKTLEVLDHLEKRLVFYDDLFFNNATVIERTKNIGVLDAKKAVGLGITGPNLRASGVKSDVRKDEPYEAYPETGFETVTRGEGDSYARVLCRRGEIAESILIVRQLLEKMPSGEIRKRLPHEIPKSDARFCFEAARGEACFYMVGNGIDKPYRVKIRGPSFSHSLMAFPYLAEGAQVADIPAIYWSLDPCPSDMDR